jgi:MFS family permease
MPTMVPIFFRVFPPFAAGYFLSYLYRVVNAVIAPDLMRDMAAGPSALGLLTAAYFIAFAAAQLPLGVLLDRYGPRRVEALLLLFAGAGSLLFARAETLTGLAAGRALIGFGVSSCLMAAMKAYTLWFSRERLPGINGFHLAAGGLGALTATVPVESMLRFTDWRTVFLLLSALTFLAAATVFFVVPEKKGAAVGESLQAQFRGIRDVFTSRNFWRIAPFNTMSQASFLAIQGLWAGPWLQQVAFFERAAAAQLLSGVAAAMVAGFICTGVLAERLSRRGIATGTTAVCGMVLFMVVQLAIIVSPISWSWPLWIAFGFLGTSGVVSYSSLVQIFPVHLSGRVTTAINLLVFVAAFFSQWAIGLCVDSFAKTETGNLSPLGFKAGFLFLLVLQMAGWLIYVYRRPAGSAASQAVKQK